MPTWKTSLKKFYGKSKWVWRKILTVASKASSSTSPNVKEYVCIADVTKNERFLWSKKSIWRKIASLKSLTKRFKAFWSCQKKFYEIEFTCKRLPWLAVHHLSKASNKVINVKIFREMERNWLEMLKIFQQIFTSVVC